MQCKLCRLRFYVFKWWHARLGFSFHGHHSFQPVQNVQCTFFSKLFFWSSAVKYLYSITIVSRSGLHLSFTVREFMILYHLIWKLRRNTKDYSPYKTVRFLDIIVELVHWWHSVQIESCSDWVLILTSSRMLSRTLTRAAFCIVKCGHVRRLKTHGWKSASA